MRENPAQPVYVLDTEELLPNMAKVPEIDFSKPDLQDAVNTKEVTAETIRRDYLTSEIGTLESRVYPAWIPRDEMPEPHIYEWESLDPDEEDWVDYPWEDLAHGGIFPPIKIAISKDGFMRILDGNHRTQFWLDNGVDFLPAWVIDNRLSVRENPDRIQTLAEKYSLTGDLADAIDLAEEYLRNHDLRPKTDIDDMEVGSHHLEIDFESIEQEREVITWFNINAAFAHREAGEWIFHIREAHPELRPGVISEDFMSPVRDIFRKARDQGYAYLCLYWG